MSDSVAGYISRHRFRNRSLAFGPRALNERILISLAAILRFTDGSDGYQADIRLIPLSLLNGCDRLRLNGSPHSAPVEAQ